MTHYLTYLCSSFVVHWYKRAILPTHRCFRSVACQPETTQGTYRPSMATGSTTAMHCRGVQCSRSYDDVAASCSIFPHMTLGSIDTEEHPGVPHETSPQGARPARDPMVLNTQTMAACVAGVGWMLWMVDRYRMVKRAEEADDLGPEGNRGPKGPALPGPRGRNAGPDHAARAVGYQEELTQLRQSLSTTGHAEECATPGRGWKQHEEQLESLASQLSLLRTEIEEVIGDNWIGQSNQHLTPCTSAAALSEATLLEDVPSVAASSREPDESSIMEQDEERASETGRSSTSTPFPSTQEQETPDTGYVLRRAAGSLLLEEGHRPGDVSSTVENWLIGAVHALPEEQVPSPSSCGSSAFTTQFAASWMQLSPAQHRQNNRASTSQRTPSSSADRRGSRTLFPTEDASKGSTLVGTRIPKPFSAPFAKKGGHSPANADSPLSLASSGSSFSTTTTRIPKPKCIESPK